MHPPYLHLPGRLYITEAAQRIPNVGGGAPTTGTIGQLGVSTSPSVRASVWWRSPGNGAAAVSAATAAARALRAKVQLKVLKGGAKLRPYIARKHHHHPRDGFKL